METIEKIIKKLEYCAENKCNICQKENGSGFPWIDGRCYGFTERLYDAIALLKMQEPVEPYMDYDGHDVWLCGNCHRKIFHPSHTEADNDEKNYRKFCFHCGRALKWE